MLMRYKVIGCLSVPLLLSCLGFYLLLFHSWTSAHVVSDSPDGMFRCEVTERSTPGESNATIILFCRRSDGEQDWRQIDSEDIYNDSASRAYYCIDWGHDANRCATKVVVLSDFSVGPHGEVIYERSLGPRAKPARGQ